MSKVRILSENLSNKIAAGEVVERPVSVVKELMENAIDAGAARVKVHVEKGGKNLVRVMDDGGGMNRDDAMLCVERYATSKLKDEDDLFRIQTLGFRGEALPSIASVSNFTLITRRPEDDVATKVILKGGKLMDVRDEGAPAGTDIMVEDLFFNTPARKKFLKTETTELSHITDLVNAMALAYPNVYFELFHNGRSIKQLVNGSPYDRVLAVLGQTLKDGLYPVDYQNDGLKITGFIGDPALARKTSMGIYAFVNGRFVKNAALFQALRDGYHQRLVKGLYPLGVLYLELPFEDVDVNVHPAKTLVRFAEQNKVFFAVKQAAALALGTAPFTARSDMVKNAVRNFTAEVVTPPEPFRASVTTKPAAGALQDNPVAPSGFYDKEKLFTLTPPKPAVSRLDNSGGSAHFSNRKPYSSAAITREETEEPPGELVFSGGQSYDLEDILADVEEDAIPATATAPASEPEQPAVLPETGPVPAPASLWAGGMANWRILGQFRNSYIICENGPELVLVDQHAAHERIAYEKLTRAAAERKADSQLLLMPEIVELSYREADALSGFLDEFAVHGLEVAAFGGSSFAVKALPPFLHSGEARQLLVDLSEQIMLKGGVTDIMDECRKTMACHSVIRARQVLSMDEMRLLLQELARCEMPHSCPHGRPTYITWTLSDIEKEFRRKL